MPLISAVIITLNEEKNIGKCLDSLKTVADEIIVIDSFSTDQTELIVKEKGAKFIRNKFDNYVTQHEFADKQATHDIIITIDADEVLSAELIDSIQKVKKYWRCDGYSMNRMTNYCGKWIKHSGWYPDIKLRLYDRRKGKWLGQKIHERFTLFEGSSKGHLKGDLLHYSYYSISQHVSQANKFTDLTALAAFEQGIKSGTLNILLNPAFKFFRSYILHFGFLDGYYGYVICRISAHATFLKYLKLRQLHLESKRRE